MHKGLTRLTLVLVCIAAVSVAYYFGIYLPRFHDAELAERQSKADLEHARRCDTDAKQFYSNFVKQMGWDSDAWPFATWHFNKKLNTCLVSVESTRVIGYKLYKTGHVMDVYGNQTLLDTFYSVEGGKRIQFGPSDTTPDQFVEQEKKLLSE